jgi:hypothetical protein
MPLDLYLALSSKYYSKIMLFSKPYVIGLNNIYNLDDVVVKIGH